MPRVYVMQNTRRKTGSKKEGAMHPLMLHAVVELGNKGGLYVFHLPHQQFQVIYLLHMAKLHSW